MGLLGTTLGHSTPTSFSVVIVGYWRSTGRTRSDIQSPESVIYFSFNWGNGKKVVYSLPLLKIFLVKVKTVLDLR